LALQLAFGLLDGDGFDPGHGRVCPGVTLPPFFHIWARRIGGGAFCAATTQLDEMPFVAAPAPPPQLP
jgi:hypothetical protein